MKRLISIVTTICLWASTLPVCLVTTGCSVNALALTNAFVASLQAIVTADPTASYVNDLDIAITAIKTAEAGWNGTTTNCAVQSAVNAAAAIIVQIDPNSKVALIATVAVAGYDALMAALAPCTTTVRAVSNAPAGLRAAPTYQATHDKLAKAWLPERAYRKAFNGAAKQSGLDVRI